MIWQARSLALALLVALLPGAVLLAGCDKMEGNPPPPRIETSAELPKQASTIVVPMSIPLSEIEAEINRVTPRQLWAINKQEPRCIPAQRVTACIAHVRKCKGDACRNVPCKIGLKKTKITPDIACRITGQVTRGAIRMGGSGSRITLAMPVSAVVSARNIGGVIKQETANGSASVRATARLSVDRNWNPVAKVDIDYDWREPPGVTVMGQRIRFVSKADAALKGVIARLERDLARKIAQVHTRKQVEGAWAQGFAVIELNRDRPPAWMRVTPQRLGFGGYQVRGRMLDMTLAAETVTETFIGNAPEKPALTPLPPPTSGFGKRGLRFQIPVLADFAQLEPVVERALGKLAKKGIVLEDIGPVDVKFGKVTIYATEGGRLAVGIKADADVINSPLKGTKGEVWLSAIPFNEPGSQRVSVRDLKIAGRTDRKVVNLLFSLFEDPKVLEEIRVALVHDFVRDYDKVMLAAKKAIAHRREGDFSLSAEIKEVQHGSILVTGQGLFLPVSVTGDARILYTPRKGR